MKKEKNNLPTNYNNIKEIFDDILIFKLSLKKINNGNNSCILSYLNDLEVDYVLIIMLNFYYQT